MRALSLLIGFVALARPCLSLEEVEAARVLYYYVAYDLDVQVWGPGKGYLAPDCKGVVISDGRCTLDEFANFISFGEASTEPSYYDLSSDVSLYPGDTAAIVNALLKIKEVREEVFVKGRRSPIGIFEDLAQIVDKDYKRAGSQNQRIKRHMGNIEKALGGLRIYQAAKLESGLVERLKSYQKDVVWKIVQEESDYRKKSWNKIDWRATVQANPDLAYAQSTLYKNTVKALKGFEQLEGTLTERHMAYKAANTFNACFR